jgi:hypothetical protein
MDIRKEGGWIQMTDKIWVGGGNNNARNPNDWSPTGVPQPGDTLSMPNGGTMNVSDNDLAGNAVHVGAPLTLGQVTFNLSHHAVLAVVQNQGTDSETTVNVAGKDTLEWSSVFPSTSEVTVNLGSHAQLTGSFDMTFGRLTVNDGPGAKLINDQTDTLGGVNALITPDVLGIGSFTSTSVQGTGGFLEFAGSVSGGQSVTLSGDPFRLVASGLRIDQPHEFHASVVMQPQSDIDLVGLAKADSYTFKNDMLSIFGGNRLIDRLRLTNDGSVLGQSHDLVVSKSGSDVWLTQSGLTAPPIDSTTLPLHATSFVADHGHHGLILA